MAGAVEAPPRTRKVVRALKLPQPDYNRGTMPNAGIDWWRLLRAAPAKVVLGLQTGKWAVKYGVIKEPASEQEMDLLISCSKPVDMLNAPKTKSGRLSLPGFYHESNGSRMVEELEAIVPGSLKLIKELGTHQHSVAYTVTHRGAATFELGELGRFVNHEDFRPFFDKVFHCYKNGIPFTLDDSYKLQEKVLSNLAGEHPGVYLFQHPLTPWIIYVGVSEKLEKRLTIGHRAVAAGLRLIAAWTTALGGDAKKLEKELHIKLKKIATGIGYKDVAKALGSWESGFDGGENEKGFYVLEQGCDPHQFLSGMIKEHYSAWLRSTLAWRV